MVKFNKLKKTLNKYLNERVVLKDPVEQIYENNLWDALQEVYLLAIENKIDILDDDLVLMKNAIQNYKKTGELTF